jgi:glutamate-1-semialdehyde 2,1-aminomutase
MIPAEREFLKGLREYCDERGAILIFDEVITGFRLALGGAQQYFGMKPDVTVLGKIIGGGLPIGAVCGREDIMERMDHTKYKDLEYAYHGGTFAGNAITLAAGQATINVLEQSPVYEHIDRLGTKVRNELNSIFQENNFPAQTTGMGSIFAIHMTDKKPLRDATCLLTADHDLSRRLFTHMLDHGILMIVPEVLHGSASYAHKESDIDHLVSTIEHFVKQKR